MRIGRLLGDGDAVDSGADLNAYAKVDGQAACCSPAMSSTGLPILGSTCGTSEVHRGLSNVLQQYDINQYAASVKVYALKPLDRTHA